MFTESRIEPLGTLLAVHPQQVPVVHLVCTRLALSPFLLRPWRWTQRLRRNTKQLRGFQHLGVGDKPTTRHPLRAGEGISTRPLTARLRVTSRSRANV